MKIYGFLVWWAMYSLRSLTFQVRLKGQEKMLDEIKEMANGEGNGTGKIKALF